MDGTLLKQLRTEKGLSQQELADLTGIPLGTIGRIESTNAEITKASTLKIFEEFFKKEKKYSHSEESNLHFKEADHLYQRKKVVTSILQGELEPIPIYDIEFSQGGIASIIELKNYNPVGSLSMPEVQGCDAIVRAKGDSMADRINDRDWIGIKRIGLDEWFPMGYIYAIITEKQELIKYVKKGSTDDTYKIISHNAFYEEDEIPKSVIKEIWSIKAVIPGKIETFV